MKIKKLLLIAFCFSLIIAFWNVSAIATPSDGVVIGATKVIDHGPDSDRFNLVLIAEGYKDTELNLFSEHVQEFIDFFFSTPPFSTNCSAFNIWKIDVASTDSGADDPAGCSYGTGAVVDTYFDATFCGDGLIRRLLVANEANAIAVLNTHVPLWDQALIIVNSNIYGGGGGNVGKTSVSGNWGNVAIHEFGHAAFGLADEYEYWKGCGIDTSPSHDHHPAVEPVSPNVTIETNRTLIKWSDLIQPTTPIPTTVNADCTVCDIQGNPYPGESVVGIYEGAHYYHCDCYRPVFNCMMRNLTQFCPVCTRRILQVIEPFQPSNTAPICDANGPYLAECTGLTTDVMLDGSGSWDFDCDPLTFTWTGPFEGGMTTGEMPSVGFAGLGAFTVELEVSDMTDSVSCTSDVIIQDSIPPLINCPVNLTIECDQSIHPNNTGEATATDVCDSAPLIDFSDEETLGECPQEKTISRTWKATDSSGNTNNCIQLINIVDTTPPQIICPEDKIAEQTSADGTPVDLGNPLVSDICDADPDVMNDAPAVFPLGNTTVTWTATDACGNSSSCTQTVTINDTIPPDITCPQDITAEQTSADGTPVDLGNPLVSDICDTDPDIINDAPAVFPLGETTVTWTATDASGNSSSCTQTVTVVDTTPPVIHNVSASPNSLWPPNHKMIPVSVICLCEDICDIAPVCRIISVQSNQPVNDLGDGNTEPDWEITGDLTVDLRAERSGTIKGSRIYTITVECTDFSGNSSTATVEVIVTHDRRDNRKIRLGG